MDEIRLDAAKEISGVFWDPKSPNETFAATLSYTPENGLELRYAPVVPRIEEFLSLDENETPYLSGVLSDGTPCNLAELWIENPTVCNTGAPAVCVPKYHVGAAIIGNASDLQVAPHFSEIQFSAAPLELICGLPQLPYTRTLEKTEVSFPQHREPIVSEAVNDSTIEFRFRPRLSIGRGKAGGHYEPVLGVLFSAPRDYERCLEYLSPVRGLLSLLVGAHVAPRSVRVIRHVKGENIPREAYVLFSYADDMPTRSPRRSAVIDFNMLGKSTSRILSTWFNSSEDEHRVFSLYLGTLFASTYVETQFLALAQAAESFHRVFLGGKSIPDDQFANVKVALRNALEAVNLGIEHKTKLSSAFEFLNEMSLHERLQALVSTVSDDTRSKLLGDGEQFIRTLKQTRNYLTHPGIKKKGAVLSTPVDFLQFNSRIAAFLRVLILRQLGSDESLVAEKASKQIFN